MNYTYYPLINTSLNNYIENYVFDYYFEIKLNGSVKNLSADLIQKFKTLEEKFNYQNIFVKNIRLTEDQRNTYFKRLEDNYEEDKLKILNNQKKIDKNVFIDYYRTKINDILLEITEQNKTWYNGLYRSPEDAFNIEHIDFLSYLCYKINMIKNENFEDISNIEFTEDFLILENKLIYTVYNSS